MSYSYEDIVRGGKGNMSIIRFVRGTQEQFDKMIDKTNMIKPDLYMKDDTIYFVIPDETKPIKETSGTSALVDGVASGSEDVDLSKRTLADDILDSAFKTKLEELLV